MYPLSRSADVDKKQQWACAVCAALEAQYDTDLAAVIRRECRCGDGKTMAQEIAGCIKAAGDLAAGCTLFSSRNRYAFLEYTSEHEVIFGYHACVCSCIKRAVEPVPMLWCECSAGYVQTMLKHVFGNNVQAMLLKTYGSGAERCEFRVVW